jgi:hypothetical protein
VLFESSRREISGITRGPTGVGECMPGARPGSRLDPAPGELDTWGFFRFNVRRVPRSFPPRDLPPRKKRGSRAFSISAIRSLHSHRLFLHTFNGGNVRPGARPCFLGKLVEVRHEPEEPETEVATTHL